MERLARRNETKLINSRKETRLKERLAERKQYLSNKLTGRNETKGTNLRGRNNTKGTIFVNGMTPKERISRWGGGGIWNKFTGRNGDRGANLQGRNENRGMNSQGKLDQRNDFL